MIITRLALQELVTSLDLGWVEKAGLVLAINALPSDQVQTIGELVNTGLEVYHEQGAEAFKDHLLKLAEEFGAPPDVVELIMGKIAEAEESEDVALAETTEN